MQALGSAIRERCGADTCSASSSDTFPSRGILHLAVNRAAIRHALYGYRMPLAVKQRNFSLLLTLVRVVACAYPTLHVIAAFTFL